MSNAKGSNTNNFKGFVPIGRVHSPIKSTPKPEYDWRDVISEIIIAHPLALGLAGLERYSHIIVIYWAHQATDPLDMALRVHYRGNPKLPIVGVFASRSPYRPNPLGQKVAELLEITSDVLRVRGLDALDGTPVLDIKPFIPDYDAPEGATAPRWEN
ncbi:MAG: tRNA (N6-threonylcarbamoyladenosine(37)-N6)-methyltransferase TrmO [Dehalococcoidia bacterium]|nr:tRNA (N6-threonylcarbamoyladenosine(37)-N6)-methyltransferase TrmO [Dehalococcoidia bacterium]